MAGISLAGINKIISMERICLLFLFVLSVQSDYLSLNGEWTAVNDNNSIEISGNVPGGIYTDLMKQKIIGDPYYRANDVDYRWVSKTPWKYSKRFQVPQEFLDYKKVNLVCEGLDTVSEISINGKVVGNSSNMFVRYTYDVKSNLKEGDNEISVAFESPIEYAENQYNKHLQEKYVVPPICPAPVQEGECHVNFIRKIQSQFSWDWGPAFPSVGIWKNIGIEGYNEFRLRDLIVSTVEEASGTWNLQLRLFFDLAGDAESDGQMEVFLNSEKIATRDVKLSPDDQLHAESNLTVSIPKEMQIEKWWPNGAGTQTLYNLIVVYSPKNAHESVQLVKKIGFRTVELLQEEIPGSEGLTFQFRINGVPLFMKGSNWIPADSFPERITPEYVRRLLQSAKDAHMNVLRVWGGGMYETDVFYQVADELGIMIWQDMMFACAMYPAVEPFLASVTEEIHQQVKRLQHHPSILIWSGNNENEAALVQNWYLTKDHFEQYKEDYLALYKATIQPIVENLDPFRPFILSSPSNGIETERQGGVADDPSSNIYGDVHYYNYNQDSWNWTIYPVPRFISEYGIQSWASFETISKVSIAEDWTENSDFFTHRQHHAMGNIEMKHSVKIHFEASETCENKIDSCDSLKTFQNFLYLSQATQAMAIKTASEHYLRHQSEISDNLGLTKGALYWQLNDIWQCPSWASIEFGGKWKMLHYYAKNFFSPLIASPFERNGTLLVYSVADAFVSSAKHALNIDVYQWRSMDPLHTVTVDFNPNPGAAHKIYEIEVDDLLTEAKCPTRTSCFLYLTVVESSSSRVVSTNFHFLSYFRSAVGLNEAEIEVSVKNGSCDSALSESECTFDLTLTSDSVAPFVWLEAKGIEGRFSDNGFIIVDPTTEIQFHSWESINAQDLGANLSVISLMDVYTSKNLYAL